MDTYHTESRSKSQQKYNVEVQKSVDDIEPPRLGTKDIGTSVRAAKDIVKNNVEGHELEFTVKEIINSHNRCLWVADDSRPVTSRRESGIRAYSNDKERG